MCTTSVPPSLGEQCLTIPPPRFRSAPEILLPLVCTLGEQMTKAHRDVTARTLLCSRKISTMAPRKTMKGENRRFVQKPLRTMTFLQEMQFLPWNQNRPHLPSLAQLPTRPTLRGNQYRHRSTKCRFATMPREGWQRSQRQAQLLRSRLSRNYQAPRRRRQKPGQERHPEPILASNQQGFRHT